MAKHRNAFLLFLVVFSGYYLLARGGLALATLNQNASPFWPATGFSIAAARVLGPKAAIFVFLGAAFANLWVTESLVAVLAMATGNAIEGLVGAYLLEKFLRLRTYLIVHADTVSVLVSTGIGALASAALGTVGLVLTGTIPSSSWISNALTWWVGNLIGGWLFLPFFLSLTAVAPMAGVLRQGWWERLRRPGEFLFVLLLSAIGSGCLFWFGEGGVLFLVFPLILFFAGRHGPLGAHSAAVVVSLSIVAATALGHGAFRGGTLNENLLNAQLFLASIAVTALVLSEFAQKVPVRRIVFVLAAGWTFAALVFHFAQSWQDERSRSRFDARILEAEKDLHAHMAVYENAIRGAASLFAASQSVGRDEWRSYIRELQLSRRYPGVLGLGVIFRVAPERLNAWLKRIRADGAPDFMLRPLPNGDNKGLEHYVITFIEPAEDNAVALGLDIASERRRREAADRSSATGFFTLTENITLVRDGMRGPGFAALLPIYWPVDQKNLGSSSANGVMGWVYAPFLVDQFFEGALQNHLGRLSVSVHEMGRGGELDPIFSSDATPVRHKGLNRDSSVELGGRKFHLSWSPGPEYVLERETLAAWLGSLSAIAALLIASAFLSAHLLHARAIRIVDERTLHLRVLAGVSELVSESKSPSELIARVAGLLARDIGWGSWYYRAFDEKSGALDPEAGPDGIAVRALKEAAPVRNLDEAGSGLAFPVKTKDRVFGVLEFPGEYSNDVPLPVVFGIVREVGGLVGDALSRLSAEAVLESQRLRLLETAKMTALGEMSGGIAHEINNPLAVIRARAEMLLERARRPEGASREQAIRAAEAILATTDRISRIIKGLRSFARNSDRDPFAGVPVSALLESTVVLCRERFKNSGVELRVSPAPCVALECREAQVVQVLLNLVNNAYDAVAGLPAPRWVQVEAVIEGDSLVVSVTDSGTGIPAELTGKIMEPFFTTKEVGKGTGLGLSVSHGIARDHRGTLTLDRNSPYTRFVLRLPLRQAEEVTSA